MSPLATIYWCIRDIVEEYELELRGRDTNLLAACLVREYGDMIRGERSDFVMKQREEERHPCAVAHRCEAFVANKPMVDADMAFMLQEKIKGICERHGLVLGKSRNTDSNIGLAPAFVLARELCRDMSAMMAMAAGTTSIEGVSE